MVAISCASNANAIAHSADWRQAVADLLVYWASTDRPYSSGEVTAALRIHRPDLRCSVGGVGRHLRDLFYSQALPPSVSGQPYYQVPRLTEGLYPQRTPAGVEVFVYAPDPVAAAAHDFEVYIPEPGGALADAPSPAVGQTQQAQQNGSGVTPVTIFGARVANTDIKATVHADGRLCVPRTAFELCVHLGAQALRGGDPVYVSASADMVTISLSDPGGGATKHSLAAERGRLRFVSPDPNRPYTPGDVYQVKAEAGKLIVHLR